MNAAAINSAIRSQKESKIKVYPCNNLRASNIGHPCERYLYLLISHWEEQEAHDVGLQNIFDLGNHLESHAINTLKEAGIEVVTGSRNWKIERPLITGREDIRALDGDTGELLPAEIKWLAPNEYERLNSQADFFRSKRHYVRGYPAQLTVYLFHFEKERGFFILGNKLTGEVKAIDFVLDWQYADGLIRKAERIYAALAAKDPAALSSCGDAAVCDRCAMAHRCGLYTASGETYVDTGELNEVVADIERLSLFVREYNARRRLLKQYMQNHTKVLTGDYLIEKRVVAKKPHVVSGCVYTKEIIHRIGRRPQ